VDVELVLFGGQDLALQQILSDNHRKGGHVDVPLSENGSERLAKAEERCHLFFSAKFKVAKWRNSSC